MGVKFDAIKDDNIKTTEFLGSSLEDINDQINQFLAHTSLGPDGVTMEENCWRIIPMGITHTTIPVQSLIWYDKQCTLETRFKYEAILMYKKVMWNE